MTPDGLTRIEGWARDGLTDAQIAAKMGIGTSTLYKYQAQHEEIVEALKRGKAPVDNEVENALLKRAMGFEYEEVTTEIIEQPDGSQRKHIKRTKRMVYPDTMAAIYWLNNRRPDLWKNRKAVEVDTADNAPVTIVWKRS